MPSPSTPARRPLSLVWRLGTLVVVAVLLTAAVVEGRRPPAVVTDPVEQALAELRALPGVAHAGVWFTRPGDGARYDDLAPDGIDEEAAREPGAWLATLTVEPSSALTTAEAVTLAERVDTSLRAAEELLEGLLDVSRLDAGALQPQLADFDGTELMEQLVAQYTPLAAARGIDLRVHGGHQVPRREAVGDPCRGADQ